MNGRLTLWVGCGLVAVGVGYFGLRSGRPVEASAALGPLLEQLYAGPSETRERAAKAVRKLGTNGLPVLLGMIRTNDFAQFQQSLKLRSRNRALVEKHMLLEHGYRQAITAFGVLGSEARPAIPALIELMNQPATTGPAAHALALIGPEVFLPLRDAIGHPDATIRFAAASALGYLNCDAKPQVTALTASLKDQTVAVRRAAADSLGKIAREASIAVTPLCECLHDSDADVRQKAAVALRSFGSQAKEAVPMLLKATADPDGEVRESAVETLKIIDPKAAVDAGIK